MVAAGGTTSAGPLYSPPYSRRGIARLTAYGTVADPRGGAPGARPPLFSEENFFFKYLLFAKQDSDLLRIQSTFERR